VTAVDPARDTRLVATHEALHLGREKRITGREVLQRLVDGLVLVPLLEPLDIEAGKLSGWDPVFLGKADGSKWVVAFTSREHLDAFCAANAEYATYLTVDTRWVVDNLPAHLGIVFNPQTGDQLQWSAQGLARFREDFLGA
jgi:hypothetical protein